MTTLDEDFDNMCLDPARHIERVRADHADLHAPSPRMRASRDSDKSSSHNGCMCQSAGCAAILAAN